MAWTPWRRRRPREEPADADTAAASAIDAEKGASTNRRANRLGMLDDRLEDEVPGSVLLLARPANRNEPLGLRNQPARTSASSLPSPYLTTSRSSVRSVKKKTTKLSKDGKIVLVPQPDDTANDPLNWTAWRRDAALFSIAYYSFIGGGLTPVLAAGFSDVADTYGVSEPSVALTTGLYMLGLGCGSVVASPTAILYGKRPVYIGGAMLLILTSVWCALSPTYVSLLLARVVQGVAVSPVECLPSASIAEIFYLHESAFRLGIYTLLLLGGKNLIPLVSAAVIQSLGWRWVFWVVAMVVAFGLCLLILFVPETFWDRTPRPHHLPRHHFSHSSLRLSLSRPASIFHHKGRHTGHGGPETPGTSRFPPNPNSLPTSPATPGILARRKRSHAGHVEFAETRKSSERPRSSAAPFLEDGDTAYPLPNEVEAEDAARLSPDAPHEVHSESWRVLPRGGAPETPMLHNLNSPYYSDVEPAGDYFSINKVAGDQEEPRPLERADGSQNAQSHVLSPTSHGEISQAHSRSQSPDKLQSSNELAMERKDTAASPKFGQPTVDSEVDARNVPTKEETPAQPDPNLPYTAYYRAAPAKSYRDTLKLYNGRLSDDKWLRVAARPFILFAYPSILWSTVVYAFSVGWLIVLSESVTAIYRNRETYNFTALQCGLVYISPFIGGILGTVVAGKISDYIVRALARIEGSGIYEPEMRLVMVIPMALASSAGLMGYGWSAEERDNWIVPTVFFGIIGFGCSLGSTTAITFAVDSYRQYAGEALVTLNFSKNVFHGFVFSLFFTHWLEKDGSKQVFIVLGALELLTLFAAIPLWIYGKRGRMWTVRKNFMEKF